jgi:outer membrane protein OmpA-like peptidoglycan-associated protein
MSKNRTNLSPFLKALSGILLSCWTSIGMAQSAVDIDAEFFNPSSSSGFFGVTDGDILPHLTVRAGFFLNFANDPLVVFIREEGDLILKPVSTQSALDVSAAIGLWRYAELSLALPVALVQRGDADLSIIDGGQAVKGGTLGDIRIQAKGRLLGDPLKKDDFQLSLLGMVKLPTGDGANFFGSPGVPFLVGLAAAMPYQKFSVGGNASFSSHPPVTIGDVTLSRDIRFGAGLSYQITEKITGLAETEGAISLDPGSRAHVPTEIRVGGRFRISPAISIPLGAGFGINKGVGAPDFRFFAGALYAPVARDADADKVPGSKDRCEGLLEDIDGFEDDDGCPDPDNDKDTILDTADKCPNEAEDFDKFEDIDGCPEFDNDKDTILDTADKCPADAEDFDKFEDIDGCPEFDNDKDSVLDKDDLCPNQPETRESETDKLKGEDNDGCPDDGIIITKTKITIKDKVYFDFNKSTLQSRSFPLLDQIAILIVEHPELTKIRVEGHTDDVGEVDYNQQLSTDRANTVVTYLIDHGVPAARLEAAGFGESKPLLPIEGKTGAALKEAQDQNRRVEFTIIE